MKNEKKRVTRVRKFLGSLALILTLSSTGCGLNNRTEPVNDPNVGIEQSTDIVDELTDMINEFGAELVNNVQSDSQTEEDNKNIEDDKDIVKDDISSEVEGKDIVDEQDNIEENTQLNINENNEIVLEDGFVIPNIGEYQGNSIVVALARAGYDSNFTTRKELATKLGIENYRGTAEQNDELLRLLKEYYEELKNNNSNNEEKMESNDNISNEQDEETNENSENSHDSNDESHNPAHDDSTDPIHNHSYRTTTTYEYDDTGHVLVTIKSCDCGDEIIKKSNKSNHTLNYVANSDGKTETASCRCGYINTRDIEKDNHTSHDFSNELRTYYKTDENGHILVTVYGCTGCTETKEVEDNKENHIFENYFENDDGKTKTGKCKCGKTHTINIDHIHDFIKTTTIYENVSANGHDLVTYRACDCGELGSEISRQTINHEDITSGYTLISSTIRNSIDENTHEIIEKRRCNECGQIYTITLAKSHNLNSSTKTINNNNGTHSVVQTNTCSCGFNETKTISTASCTYEWIDNGDGTKTQVCSVCGHKGITQQHDHNMGVGVVTDYKDLGDGRHQEKVTSKCTISGCNHEETKDGNIYSHSQTGNQVSSEWKIDGDTHTLVVVYECPDCLATFSPAVGNSHNATWGEYVEENGVLVAHCTHDGCPATKEKDLNDHANHTETYTYRCNENNECVRTATCSQCPGFSREDIVEHALEYGDNYNTDEGHFTQVRCKNCGYTDILKEEHTFEKTLANLVGAEDLGGTDIIGVFKCLHCDQTTEDFITRDMYNEYKGISSSNETANVTTNASVTTTYSETNDANLAAQETEENNNETYQAYVVSEDIYDEMVTQIIKDMENEELVEQDNVVTDGKTIVEIEDEEKVLSLAQ